MGLVDTLLDTSVVASFDASGFRRHAASRPPGPRRDLTDRAVLVTGGTAGIGLATGHALAQLGARPILWGRDPQRGQRAADALPQATFQSVDLTDLQATGDAAHRIPRSLAAVVLNAGAMPLTRQTNDAGEEAMWASQVLGHLRLIATLRDQRQLTADTRVIWVSSGGGLTVRLGLSDIDGQRPYARHRVYAKVKRAQLVLNRELAQRWPEVWTAAMHPGWVDTEAVRHSMPWFHRLMRGRLRTPEQGADTLVWLVSTALELPSGRLWFDRAEANPYPLPGTRESPDQVDALLQRVAPALDVSP